MLVTGLLILGILAVIIAGVLLIATFVRHNDMNDVVRLVALIQGLGGILLIFGGYADVFVGWMFYLVGIGLVISAWILAYNFRVRRPKRKVKAKRYL